MFPTRTRSILVRAIWDPEAGVFVATSDDVPGLATEGKTLQELEQKLQLMIPELLELNGLADSSDEGYEVPLHLVSERFSKIRIAG